jgi:hypothetical protein
MLTLSHCDSSRHLPAVYNPEPYEISRVMLCGCGGVPGTKMKTMGFDRIDKLLERRKFTVVPRRIFARPVPAPPKRKAAAAPAQKETLASS